jgi:RimJ/RimL family protein N-acetyltransferase
LRGRGIATETVGGMMVYGQLEYRLHEIIVTLNPANGASQRVLVKAGLSFQEDRTHYDGSIIRVMVWVA